MRRAREERRSPLRRADVLLIAGILLFSVIGWALASQAGDYAGTAEVRVTMNGELYGIYPLSEAREIAVNGDYENRIVIEENAAGEMQARMRDATCPGQDCVHHAAINLSGQNIVCLPNRVLVEISGEGNDIDAYTY
jgi:hypothetical protein